ncbi:hypothetical protein CKO51_09080 [Rhodopirellula sp. SM50]|nr:hypothetical protein CKO51_09080 [Rhodopirellula sp. SM50]
MVKKWDGQKMGWSKNGMVKKWDGQKMGGSKNGRVKKWEGGERTTDGKAYPRIPGDEKSGHAICDIF